MRKIKLIWDFRYPDPERFAEHHAKHLSEFILKKNYPLQITGSEKITPDHFIAYLVVNENDMPEIRDILKPHRAVVFQENSSEEK